MDDIIAEWGAELDRRSRAFTAHAEALSRWDAAILGNRGALLALEAEVSGVVAGQEGLERRLALLETHQQDIHDCLSGMEGEAEALHRSEASLADDGTRERDRLYERAEALGATLAMLGEQLKEAIADTNSSAGEQPRARGRGLGAQAGPMTVLTLLPTPPRLIRCPPVSFSPAPPQRPAWATAPRR